MKNDNDYISAISEERVRIMGVILRPFSVGHYLLLKKYECNFVSDTPVEITISDLVIGIAICSRKFDEFLDFVNDVNAIKWIKKWGRKINGDIKNNPNYFIEREVMFRQYLTDGMRIPKYWLLVEQDSPSNSGKLLEHIITTLQGKLGYTREEVLNAPFNQAIFDYFLYLEQSGIIQLMNDEDLELVEAANG